MDAVAALKRVVCAATLIALLLPAAGAGPASAAEPTPAVAPATMPAAGRTTFSFPSDSAVHAILQARVETGQAVGLVVGLLEPDGAQRFVAFGKSGGPGDRPLDAQTVFEIGSVTKVFTGTVLADMVRRGEVRFDQPVAELLPKTVRVPAKGDTLITLVDLATQHSGLPRVPSNMAPKDPANPYADYTSAQLYDFLAHETLKRAPGTAYEYSNLGMGLLGYALALRAGKSYEELVTERVLEPLRMSDTRITLTPDMTTRLAAGHDASGKVVGNWDLPVLAGAGALRSTAFDLMRFVAANLDSNQTPISADLRETHRPRHRVSGPQLSIGLAWHLVHSSAGDFVMHNGGTGGYHSFIGFDPATRAGVVVLSNSSNDIDDIAIHLLDSSVPLKQAVRHTEVKLSAARLDALAGRYALAPAFILTVTHEGDGLFIQATGQQKLPVFAESDSTFFYRAVEAEISFERDASGKAKRLVLHQNGRDTPGARVE